MPFSLLENPVEGTHMVTVICDNCGKTLTTEYPFSKEDHKALEPWYINGNFRNIACGEPCATAMTPDKKPEFLKTSLFGTLTEAK